VRKRNYFSQQRGYAVSNSFLTELAMSEIQPIRPSKMFYALGIAFMLVGLGGCVYTVFHGIFHITDKLTQISMPGEKNLVLLPDSTYTIFLERQSVMGGRIYSTEENLTGLTCHVSSLASGNQLRIYRPTGSTTYNVGGRSGRSVLAFDTKEAGTYHFLCDYEPGSTGPQVVLAVGTGIMEDIIRIVFVCNAWMILAGGVGAILLVLVFMRRERYKKTLAQNPGSPLG
jgi:hypothetical protein